jgi:hypothetical protein
MAAPVKKQNNFGNFIDDVNKTIMDEANRFTRFRSSSKAMMTPRGSTPLVVRLFLTEFTELKFAGRKRTPHPAPLLA